MVSRWKQSAGTYFGRERVLAEWDVPYYERMQLNLERKEAIAREAMLLLEEGGSVFIDGNTSGLALSRFVPDDKNLTIVTNSAMVTLNLIQKKGKLKVYRVDGEVDEDGIHTLVRDEGTPPFKEFALYEIVFFEPEACHRLSSDSTSQGTPLS